MDFNDWFIYDESSPSCLRWKVNRWAGEDYRQLRVAIGTPVGTKNRKGYWRVILMKKSYSVHRAIWMMFHGPIARDEHIDHINRDKADNRISNLRLVTNDINKRNSGMYANNTSGVTGVREIVMGGKLYWCATWAELMTHRRRCAYFRVEKFGFDEAFKMACERRTLEIAKLNEQGAQYSETHGM